MNNILYLGKKMLDIEKNESKEVQLFIFKAIMNFKKEPKTYEETFVSDLSSVKKMYSPYLYKKIKNLCVEKGYLKKVHKCKASNLYYIDPEIALNEDGYNNLDIGEERERYLEGVKVIDEIFP